MRFLFASLLAFVAAADTCICSCNPAYPSSAIQTPCDPATTCTEEFCHTFSQCNSTSVFVDNNCQASVPDASFDSLYGTYNVQPGLDCLPGPDGSLGACVPKCSQYSDTCDCMVGTVTIAPGSTNSTFLVTVTVVGHTETVDDPPGPTMTSSSEFTLSGPATAYGSFEFEFNNSVFPNFNGDNTTQFVFTRDPDGKEMIMRVPSNSYGLGCQVVLLMEGAEKVSTWKLIVFIAAGVVFLGLAFLFYKKCCSDSDDRQGSTQYQSVRG